MQSRAEPAARASGEATAVQTGHGQCPITPGVLLEVAKAVQEVVDNQMLLTPLKGDDIDFTEVCTLLHLKGIPLSIK